MPNDENTITVDREVLKSVFAEQKAEITNEVMEAVKQENAALKIPELIKKGFRNNVTNVRIVADRKHSFGTILRALGKSVIENKSLATIYTEWGKDIQNFMPENVASQITEQKGLNMSVIANGGAMVFEQYASEFIQLLTDASVLRLAGVPVIDMPAGNLTYGKVTAGTSAFWRGETDNRTAAAPTFGQVKLDIKTLCANVNISDKLLRYGSVNVDALVQQRIIEDLALKEDETLLLTGTGTVNTPKSLYNWTPAANQFTMTATPTAAKIQTDLMKLKRALLKAKVRMVKPCWFMTPSCRTEIEAQIDTNSNPMFWARELFEKNTLFGYPVYTTTQLTDAGGTTSNILLTDLSQCILGQGMGVTIEFIKGGSYYNGSATISGQVTGESVYTCELDEDFTIGNDVAVARLISVTWGIA